MMAYVHCRLTFQFFCSRSLRLLSIRLLPFVLFPSGRQIAGAPCRRNLSPSCHSNEKTFQLRERDIVSSGLRRARHGGLAACIHWSGLLDSGTPSPILWEVVTGLCALLPVFGSHPGRSPGHHISNGTKQNQKRNNTEG